MQDKLPSDRQRDNSQDHQGSNDDTFDLRKNQHRATDRRQHHRRSQIRLLHDERKRNAQNEEGDKHFFKTHPVTQRTASCQNFGHQHDQCQLHRFRRLIAEESQINPTLRTQGDFTKEGDVNDRSEV
ncbi:hypothetical protein D3C87_1342920 [compost metagenome]